MEMQTKITSIFLLPSVRMAKTVKMTENVSVDIRKENTYSLLEGTK